MPTHDPCARTEQTQSQHGDICIYKSNVPWVSDDFPLPLCAEELAMRPTPKRPCPMVCRRLAMCWAGLSTLTLIEHLLY